MSSEHNLNWMRKPALAIIGVVILFFVLAIGCQETKTEEKEMVTTTSIIKETEEKKVSDLSLYFDCKPKIQEQLANPKSFDPIALSVKYNFVDNQHIVGFDFYEENGLGGQVMQQAICSFDVDGNILKYGVL